MRLSFAGLEIALTGLYTSQKGISVASNNIANASTEGYSRQVGKIVANTPYTVHDGSGMVGTGSELVGVESIRDTYLDYIYWSQNSSSNEWNIKESGMKDLEVTFNETSNFGLTKSMQDFYSSLQELSKYPDVLPYRSAVKEKTVSLANNFNSMANQLEKLQKDNNFGVKSTVDQINSYAIQIRDLNEQIYKTELNGSVANELRDKRALVVDQLSKLTDVEVSENTIRTLSNGVEDKRFVVSINGHQLVNHVDSYKIDYIQRDAAHRKNPSDVDGLYDLQWSDGSPLKVNGGELKGYLDIRDGNGDASTGSQNPYKGIPYYMDRLNFFVRKFAQSLNEGINGGKGFEDGYGLDGSTGIKMFTANGQSSGAFSDYSTLTAKNISVSSDILGNDGIKKIPLSNVVGESTNSNVLLDVLSQRHDSKMFAEGTPEDFVKSIVSTLGIDSQEAQKLNKLETAVVTHTLNKRESVSGVSIDEEMTNIVRFQQIYNASAKMITVMDELYDTTVNRLGNSGR